MKHVLYILGIPFITVGFICIVIFVEIPVLEVNPPQLSEHVTIEQWLSSFQFWAIVCVVVVGLTSFIWCGFGHKVFKTIHENPSGKRILWIVLFFVSAAIALAIIFFGVERAENESWLVYLFFGMNALVPYYLATVFFSPTSVKYTPIGAMQIRRF